MACNTYIFVIMLSVCVSSTVFGAPSRADPSYAVVMVVDGDTIKLSNKKIVDLAGIDAPEKTMSGKLRRDALRAGKSLYDVMKMGRDSAGALYALVGNKRVWLEYDIQKKSPNGSERAYVYLENGEMINAKMVEQGQAFALQKGPNQKYRKLFIKLEKDAQKAKQGIWTDLELDIFHN